MFKKLSPFSLANNATANQTAAACLRLPPPGCSGRRPNGQISVGMRREVASQIFNHGCSSWHEGIII